MFQFRRNKWNIPAQRTPNDVESTLLSLLESLFEFCEDDAYCHLRLSSVVSFVVDLARRW